MDFEHAYLLRDWLFEMMMSFTSGDLPRLRGGDKLLGGRFSVDLCERGMYGRSIGDLAFCSTEFSGYWIR